MSKRVPILLVLLFFNTSCSKSSEEKETVSSSATAQPATACARSSKHPSERAALQLIRDVQAGKFARAPYVFEADREFPKERREELSRSVERYIKNRQWCPWHTRVELYDGIDDAADVILKATSGEYLVLLVGYEYADQRWQASAYEFPEMTFKKPQGLSFVTYVEQGVREAKKHAVPFARRYEIDEQGAFYIE